MYIVTGGAGFIGSNIANMLSEKNVAGSLFATTFTMMNAGKTLSVSNLMTLFAPITFFPFWTKMHPKLKQSYIWGQFRPPLKPMLM